MKPDVWKPHGWLSLFASLRVHGRQHSVHPASGINEFMVVPKPKSKPTPHIDGCSFSTLEEFFDHVGARLIPGVVWGHNLDAFNDILRGGFGRSEGGFVLCWKDHDISRQRLGYDETVRQLQKKLARCHPDNVASVEGELAIAISRRGPTAFDWLVEIIECHGADGSEPEDGVELQLQ